MRGGMSEARRRGYGGTAHLWRECGSWHCRLPGPEGGAGQAATPAAAWEAAKWAEHAGQWIRGRGQEMARKEQERREAGGKQGLRKSLRERIGYVHND